MSHLPAGFPESSANLYAQMVIAEASLDAASAKTALKRFAGTEQIINCSVPAKRFSAVLATQRAVNVDVSDNVGMVSNLKPQLQTIASVEEYERFFLLLRARRISRSLSQGILACYASVLTLFSAACASSSACCSSSSEVSRAKSVMH